MPYGNAASGPRFPKEMLVLGYVAGMTTRIRPIERDDALSLGALRGEVGQEGIGVLREEARPWRAPGLTVLLEAQRAE